MADVPYDLGSWIEKQAGEVGTAVATRAALCVLPLILGGFCAGDRAPPLPLGQIALPCFRAAASAWASEEISRRMDRSCAKLRAPPFLLSLTG